MLLFFIKIFAKKIIFVEKEKYFNVFLEKKYLQLLITNL